MHDRRVLGAGGLLVVALCAYGVLGSFPTAGDRLGFRRFVTPEVTGSLRLGQTFVMDADGLSAIEIHPVAMAPVQGSIRLELRSYAEDSPAIRSAEVSAADFVRNETYRFEFDPVQDSLDRLLRLDISSVPGAPSRGVAMRATRGERFRDGTLLSNGVERWADLGFQTHAVFAPPGRRALPFALAGLAISWTALVFVLRELAAT